MLSILIPVYNYNITLLVNDIHRQLIKCNIAFEIICLDDNSNQNFRDENIKIEKLSFTTYKLSNTNNGRTITRQLLTEQSTYTYLLFLDADVLPCQPNFIDIYISYLKKGCPVVFGGIAYQSQRPDKRFMLRWTYGRSNESSTAAQRMKAPYRSITSPNFLIEKSIFEAINATMGKNNYGYDILFASRMKQKRINVLHIDNEVFHLGIETSVDYLKKSEDALQTYLTFWREGDITSEDNKLIKLFVILKRYKLNFIVSSFFKLAASSLRKNLLGEHPSIALFQLYRLSYLCTLDLRPT